MINAWFERLFDEGRVTQNERAELYRMARSRRLAGHKARPFATQSWICSDADGNILWQRTAGNLWTTQGATWLLGNALTGGSATATYLGLISGGTAPVFVIGDTAASHSGWTEVPSADVTAGVRQTLVWGSPSGGVVNNSAAQISYTMSASLVGSLTLWGGFLSDSNVLGGTSLSLISEAIFDQGFATVAANNTIQILVTVTILAG